MQASCTYGSVRGAPSNGRSYRDSPELRLTKMTARPFHPKKDEAAQEAFKANFKAIVEAELPDEVIRNGLPLEVWFQDEARVGQQGTLSRLWAAIGSRPAMARDNRRTPPSSVPFAPAARSARLLSWGQLTPRP